MKVSSHAYERLASEGGNIAEVAKDLAAHGKVTSTTGLANGLTNEDLRMLRDSDECKIIAYLFNQG